MNPNTFIPAASNKATSLPQAHAKSQPLWFLGTRTQWGGVVLGKDFVFGPVGIQIHQMVQVTDAVRQRADGEVLGGVRQQVPDQPLPCRRIRGMRTAVCSIPKPSLLVPPDIGLVSTDIDVLKPLFVIFTGRCLLVYKTSITFILFPFYLRITELMSI